MKINTMTFNTKHQQGFSIIEVMVAMVIGLVLMVGVFEVFFSSRESQQIVSDQVELVDESRTALDLLAYDVKKAGLWGKTHDSNELIKNKTSFTSVLGQFVGVNDCINSLGNTNNPDVGQTGWALDIFKPIRGISESSITANGGIHYTGCINGAYLTGTDTLELRYAGEAVAAANLDSNTVYIVSQGQFSDMFYGGAAGHEQPATAKDFGFGVLPTDPEVTYHRYEAVLYYVSTWTDEVGDGVPSLRRVSLQSGPKLSDDVVLTGVENLQVQFGVDLDKNTVTQGIQQYLDPASMTDSQWSQVRSVQAWMVVRSKQSRPENASQTFIIPAITGGTYTTPTDGYKRLMMTTTNKLRNIEFVEEQ